MAQLCISHSTFHLSDHQILTIPELTIQANSHWAFIGANGSGKSSLAKALTLELPSLTGNISSDFKNPFRLSFEQLQQLINEEWDRNNSDLLGDDEDDSGYTAAEIIQFYRHDNEECLQLAAQFGIRDLLSRRFKYLSTGETRKVLLCQALMAEPDLLVLDEPFDGLDVYSRKALAELLSSLTDKNITLVLILNRFTDIPEFIEHVGVLSECTLTLAGDKETILRDSLVAQLAYSEQLQHITLPEVDDPATHITIAPDVTRIELKNGVVKYNDKPILCGLDWYVNAGEHWHIMGENGAGKSTLLSLITGDHPQGYSNDLTLFGRRRGSGETIWDIKRHIGYVSNSIHSDYRVNTNVRTVIISGFFDSIGLYNAPSDKQIKLANEWLSLLGLSAQADMPFHQLSWGQQRLILIARALVKHPTLLILDEPLQGLDPLNRQLVLRFITVMIANGDTQLLFVSHHQEDIPSCINRRLRFVPDDNGLYRYEIDEITAKY